MPPIQKYLVVVTIAWCLGAMECFADVIGFQGPYAPSNWTATLAGDGSVDTSQAPSQITVNGADDWSGNPADVDYTITIPSNGQVSEDVPEIGEG